MNKKGLNFRSPTEFVRELRATQKLIGLTDNTLFLEACVRCLETRTLPFRSTLNLTPKKTHNNDPVHTIMCNPSVIRKIKLLILQHDLGNVYTLLYYGLKCIQGQYGVNLSVNGKKDDQSSQVLQPPE